MNDISLHRPLEGEPLLRPITHRTGSRFASLLISCGLVTVETALFDERISGGFFESADAGVVVIATSCDRPLFYHECEVLAHFSHKDLALMRFDPLEGGSFDVLLEGGQVWQCNYFAWRREGDDLWLSPAHTEGPFFRLSGNGLQTFQGAPYESGYQRHAGIMRAVETPSFAGRF